MKKVTAGREELGDFAPKFAQLNDDVLFGEVWAREEPVSYTHLLTWMCCEIHWPAYWVFIRKNNETTRPCLKKAGAKPQ